MAQQSVELRDITARLSIDNTHPKPRHDMKCDDSQLPAPRALPDLPLVDRGKDAWLFLAACWVVEAFIFGFGASFGVFQDFYSTHEPFAKSGSVAIIGTTTMGIMYIGFPLFIGLCRLYPRWGRWSTMVGLFAASLSMATSSFCNNVPQLIVSQGVMFGLGGCIACCPCQLYIDEWFARRKGLAYGIAWSAGGVGGVVFPLIMETLLHELGFQKTLRIWAGILFACSAPLAFFIRPRLPYSASIHQRRLNLRFIMSKRFALHQVANTIQATGYFLPSIYLPTYARSVFGTSAFLSALTVMLVNVATTMGLVIMGSLSDKFHVTTCMIISAMGAAISVLVVWGLSASLPVLYLFCVLYGLFAGSWASVWPGIMKEVSQNGERDGYGHVDPVMVQGMLCVGRGVGNVISGPLSNSLLGGMPWRGQAMSGYSSGYGVLILYTGFTGLLSGMNYLLKRLKLL
ncbi:major facilitator superfamily domain-containing protein [Truncatella angustata]|uniref:Major facilitator superfamily domain-containing protein n=1 Tax=Truncatella angustata TaxID=152316 RepID=A0A9P8ULT6_9PEZI|nr:major facilitator superfamily domain-containing protein [Truncatella angustata]KAH6654459.1 major facilitator superfamily domain-containing protein [Truncatella angustata]